MSLRGCLSGVARILEESEAGRYIWKVLRCYALRTPVSCISEPEVFLGSLVNQQATADGKSDDGMVIARTARVVALRFSCRSTRPTISRLQMPTAYIAGRVSLTGQDNNCCKDLGDLCRRSRLKP